MSYFFTDLINIINIDSVSRIEEDSIESKGLGLDQ